MRTLFAALTLLALSTSFSQAACYDENGRRVPESYCRRENNDQREYRMRRRGVERLMGYCDRYCQNRRGEDFYTCKRICAGESR